MKNDNNNKELTDSELTGQQDDEAKLAEARKLGLDKEFDNIKITSNFAFQLVFYDADLCKRLLEEALGISIDRIEVPEAEKTILADIDTKQVRFDIYVKDSSDNAYDIKMQVIGSGFKLDEFMRRIRAYLSVMDTFEIKRGAKYRDLKKSCVIFFVTDDPFGLDYKRYDLDLVLRQNPKIVNPDDTKRVIFNCQGHKGEVSEDIQNFLDYMKSGTVEGDFVSSVDKRLNAVRRNKNWRKTYMFYALEKKLDAGENFRAGQAQGKAEGVAEGENKLVRLLEAMVKKGKNAAEIIAEKSKSNNLSALYKEYGIE
ncbi:MAG: Rpn family recombination-promoting nuclease/putative transposase [Succinivibrio sp.]|nr:Rpn family recombination-promoting nuclease/putative transposase [Succinivibrio sp.]